MKIEDLLNERKNQLDVEEPPLEAWDQISKGVSKEQHSVSMWWKVAAILLVALSLGLLVNNQILKGEVEKLASLGDLSEEYSSIENDYLTQINQIEKAIPIVQLKNKDEYQWLFEELSLLEEINTMYRSDIGKVDDAQLVRILIDYYEKKIKLLKKLELEVERNSKQIKNEATTNDHISI